jgi:antitoxin component of MazEF toxin-antitoxin module
LLSGVGRVLRSGRSLMIRVPVDVARDSAFPFQIGDTVSVTIGKDNKIIVEKL